MVGRKGVLILLASTTIAGCSTSTGTASPTGTPPAAPLGTAVVFGGIDPCTGLASAALPRYAAGTVTVYEGSAVLPTQGLPVFPSAVVAGQTVVQDGLYRFVLGPGSYVLVAEFPPPSNVTPFRSLTVQAGATVEADIPNMCK